MATVKANSLQHLASYVIRPALVEAKLITEKHASDAVYMVTLGEELLNNRGEDCRDGKCNSV